MIPNACGLYEIVNLINGLRYVGSASNLNARWRAHKSYLSRGVHDNHYLQNAWNKYGADAFRFNVLMLTSKENKLLEEQKLLDLIFANGTQGYNLSPKVEGGFDGRTHSEESKHKIALGRTGWKHTEETRQKISNSKKGGVLSEERKAQISMQVRGSGNPMYGKRHSDESKARMGLPKAGKALSDEHRQKIGAGVRAWLQKRAVLSSNTQIVATNS